MTTARGQQEQRTVKFTPPSRRWKREIGGGGGDAYASVTDPTSHNAWRQSARHGAASQRQRRHAMRKPTRSACSLTSHTVATPPSQRLHSSLSSQPSPAIPLASEQPCRLLA